jgi:hypothetical protein
LPIVVGDETYQLDPAKRITAMKIKCKDANGRRYKGRDLVASQQRREANR